MHSKKENVQLLVQALELAGIQDVVISPGSRNAPLVLEFSENPFFNNYSIVDERSAGFFALGLAQNSGTPAILCCTSGSALANYYPAITEAFYQNIPLIVISADRPANYTDIFDGQTIRQFEIFKNHSWGNYELKENIEDSYRDYLKIIQNAIQQVLQKKGPVHINVPLSEPLYETVEKPFNIISDLEIKEKKIPTINFNEWREKWNGYERKLILCGILPPDTALQKSIYQMAEDQNAVILSESTSNLHHANIFSSIDSLIFNWKDDDFQNFKPDILLTIGQNIVSKKVKQFLRNVPLKAHWHLDEYWSADTFFQLSEYFEQPKAHFLNKLFKPQEKSEYFTLWQNLAQKRSELQKQKLENTPFSDVWVYQYLSNNLPIQCALQFGNSSAIRYSQLFDFTKFQSVNSNRGTSGIEGSIATSIGASIKNEVPTFLILGDISFFYESNSLWNQYIPKNFKIIMINNGGGEIFNFIPGPQQVPKKETYLTTTHHRNAENIAREFQFSYFKADSQDSLSQVFTDFLNENSPSILEIDTRGIENSDYLKNFLN